MNTARAAFVTALVAAVLPAAAGASTISVSASAGPSASEYIDYRASKGEDNRVRVLIKDNLVVLVDKSTKRIRAARDAGFGRCRTTSARRAVCPGLPVFVSLRDGNDRFSVAPGDIGAAPAPRDPLDYAESYEDTEGAVTETTFVDTGKGDDYMSGSRFNDVFLPGPGKDRVEARGGPDQVYLEPDGVLDAVHGGGEIDAVTFASSRPLTVDLAARSGGPAGDQDGLRGLERVHGGRGNDMLLGGSTTDALYGEGGSDSVDGRGGNDLVVGDSPFTVDGSVNTLIGGDGDDVLDTRTEKAAPTSSVACGPGSDRHAGGVDARLDAACELTIPRLQFGSLTFPADETLFPDSPTKALPVAKTGDTVTFDVACPGTGERNHSGCAVAVSLERAPVAGATGSPEQFGSGAASIAPGARGNVTVTLNAAGEAAVASGDPVAVRVAMDLQPLAGSAPGAAPARARWGWQADL